MRIFGLHIYPQSKSVTMTDHFRVEVQDEHEKVSADISAGFTQLNELLADTLTALNGAGKHKEN